MNTDQILEIIGRRNLANALGVKLGTISAASVAGKLPSSWFYSTKMLWDQQMKALPDSERADLDMSVFSWKGTPPANLNSRATDERQSTGGEV